MPRFVILEHDWPHRHYDVMLEAGAILRTWRIAAFPLANQQIAAEPIGNHRLVYLDYEGPVGGGRGQVNRVDEGDYIIIDDQPLSVTVELRGRVSNGRFTLQSDQLGSTKPR